MNRLAGIFTMCVGALAIAWVAAQAIEARWYQRQASRWLAGLPPDLQSRLPFAIAPLPAGFTDIEPARLEIPRIGLETMIVPGATASALRHGVAHLAGTATLSETGNVGLAAHRDTFFRPLGDVAVGDTIRVVTAATTYVYAVTWFRVVDPESVSVLDPTPERALTLVTCYPFRWIGPAPDRFVVRACGIPETTKPSPVFHPHVMRADADWLAKTERDAPVPSR